jgi:hypothetical protein
MINYRVEIRIQADAEAEWLAWMRKVHIPEVVQTGCFSGCQIYKVIDSDQPEPTYVMQYRCRSLEDYRRYRDRFAPALQKKHSDRFAQRFFASRQLLEDVGEIQREETAKG